MEQNQNINLECIKAESDLINTKYHNICTGEVTVVPTGTFDYMVGIPVVLFLFLSVGVMISLFIFTIRDRF